MSLKEELSPTSQQAEPLFKNASSASDGSAWVEQWGLLLNATVTESFK